MATLDGSGRTIDLGGGYRIAAPGLLGNATVHQPREPGSTDRGPELATSALDGSLAASGVTEVMTIELRAQDVGIPEGVPTVRTSGGEEGLVLETPDLGATVGQVVLAVDESGAVTWNFPESHSGGIETPSVRGAGDTKRFLIRRHTPAPPPESEAAERGLFGAIGRKVLKVLVYPVADAVLGPITEHFAGKWEAAKRPYRVRTFGPDDYRLTDRPELTAAQWRQIASGRSLLFVHGTFSTSHGGFGGVPHDTMKELHRLYEGRVFAFDHHTLSATPEQNVAEFASRVPDGLTATVDVISHSRGGLVARTLAGELPDSLVPGLSVDRAVLVAAPNHGTPLADPEHMVALIDRYTSVLNLIPPGPLDVVAEVLEAIVTVVKVVGHAFLSGLGGLTAMDPGGAFIRRINVGGPPRATYYGIAADFEPTGGLRDLVKQTIADQVLDRVFAAAANDLVVPTTGVFAGSADPAFPLPDDRVLRFGADAGVSHSAFFGHPTTSAVLLDWLATGR